MYDSIVVIHKYKYVHLSEQLYNKQVVSRHEENTEINEKSIIITAYYDTKKHELTCYGMN